MDNIRIITVAETGSTNDDMMALARQGEAEGVWLRAECQTGGRGRQGRAWASPSGNLYTTTLVRLVETDPAAATLALVTSIALRDAVAVYVSDGLVLKWPNDLLLQGAKLSGILLEREKDAVIIGMGVNLAHHPENLGRPVTSLAVHVQQPNPVSFLVSLAELFAKWLAIWRDHGVAEIRKEWLARAHPIGTQLRTHDPNGKPIEGTFDGLTPEGSLQLCLADGSVRVIHAGDVFLI